MIKVRDFTSRRCKIINIIKRNERIYVDVCTIYIVRVWNNEPLNMQRNFDDDDDVNFQNYHHSIQLLYLVKSTFTYVFYSVDLF